MDEEKKNEDEDVEVPRGADDCSVEATVEGEKVGQPHASQAGKGTTQRIMRMIQPHHFGIDIASLIVLDAVMNDYESFEILIDALRKCVSEVDPHDVEILLARSLKYLINNQLVIVYAVDSEWKLVQQESIEESEELSQFYYYRSELGRQLIDSEEAGRRLTEVYDRVLRPD